MNYDTSISKEKSAPAKCLSAEKNLFLKLKSEFEFVKENGKKYVSKSFIMLYIKPPIDHHLRIGVICGKKFSKKAVTRNRVRRIFKEAFRLLKKNIIPSHIIFIPKKNVEKAKMQLVKQEMMVAFQKCILWINK